MNTNSFFWATVVIVVVPLTVLAVSEFDERLRQRDSPMRPAIEIVRTWALPFFAVWAVLRPVLGRDVDSLGVQLATTGLILALGAAVLRVSACWWPAWPGGSAGTGEARSRSSCWPCPDSSCCSPSPGCC